jgi:isopentenyldiphosphate isomerase
VVRLPAGSLTFRTWICSHPLFTEGELEVDVGVKRAAIRKLEHELGIPISTFTIDDLAYVSTVMYKVGFGCPN